MPIFSAHSVDPDQVPSSAASELGLQCFPIIFCGVEGVLDKMSYITQAQATIS